jgi:UDP-glucose 4-epimerase
VVIARLFNTVGPRQAAQYGMVIPRFIRQAFANEPLTVYGDGTQTRAFAHVEDTVRALTGLMDSEDARGQVFNVGSTEEITIAELARLVIEQTGSSSTIRFLPFEEAYDANFEDLTRRVPDLSRIHAAIGYQPARSIRDVIADVIAHEKQVNQS